MLRDQRRLRAGGIRANARFTTIKFNIWTDILMLHLCIDSEILAAAAAVWLRLSGRNQMPNNSQTDSCVEKVMKTHRKINIFRLDLATEDAASEKHFADVSFYLNKTHISEIDYEIARRAHGPLRAHSCRARVPDCVIFILPKNYPPESKKKHCKYAGKKRSNFWMPKSHGAKCPYKT